MRLTTESLSRIQHRDALSVDVQCEVHAGESYKVPPWELHMPWSIADHTRAILPFPSFLSHVQVGRWVTCEGELPPAAAAHLVALRKLSAAC